MTLASSTHRNLRVSRQSRGFKFRLSHVVYGLIVIYGFTASNYVAFGLLLVCCFAFIASLARKHTIVSGTFLLNLYLLLMFIVLYRPTLQIVAGESASYGMPISWVGMMSTGYFVARLKPKDDPTHIVVTYLCLAISAACIVPYSIFLTLQYRGATDLSTVVLEGHRWLIAPLQGKLITANGIANFASLMIATVGLLFINTRSRYESRLHSLATCMGVISVIFCAVIGSRQSVLYFVVALAIGFMFSVTSKQRSGIALSLVVVTLLGCAYYLDLFNLKAMLEGTFVFQRLSTTSFADDGRWVYLAQAVRDLEHYGLKGGGGYNSHNAFLFIWLSGGIVPFGFFALLLSLSIVNGARLLLQQQVALRTRYVIASVGIIQLGILFQGGILVPNIWGYLYFTIGVLSALVETDSPRERLTYSTDRKD